MNKYLCWFSCGVTSAVACKIAVKLYGKENCILIYIGIKSAHPDNDRFIRECEKWIGTEILERNSKYYADQYEVIKKIRYINGVAGAPCTKELKKEVRYDCEKEFEWTNQVFGFEFERAQINRAVRFKQQYPHTKPIYPLIDMGRTKEECASLLISAGIELPEMYKLGFHNNNCIGCVKGGMGYWNKIKQHFPESFDKMAVLEREIGASCINGKYLDELKDTDGRHDPPIVPDCGLFCEIEFADLIDPETHEIINKEKTK